MRGLIIYSMYPYEYEDNIFPIFLMFAVFFILQDPFEACENYFGKFLC